MADIEFKDFSAMVKQKLDSLAESVLEEVGGEIESQAKQNTKVGRASVGVHTKNSWKHTVEKTGGDKWEATIGNPLEKSIWVEFGTGDYALEGKGRKGGWYVLIGNGEGQIRESVVKAYGFRIYYGKDGKRFIFTNGIQPQRPLHKAYASKKNWAIKHTQDRFKGGLS